MKQRNVTRGNVKRRVLLVVGVVVFLLLSIPASFVVRGVFFPPTFDVESIASSAAYQDREMLKRAWALPVARTFKQQVDYQENGSLCGPTSVANVLRSLNAQPAHASGVLEGSGKCEPFGICFGGLTLDELAGLLRAKSNRRVTVLRDLDLNAFRRELREANNPARRYIINFQRGLLFGQGTGHHSPLAGYLEDQDLVFVLDVNAKFGPWLVKSERLFTAMDSMDSSTGLKRGLLRVE